MKPKPEGAGPDPTRLLTRRELAAALPANPRTISRWLEEGLMPAKPGKGGKPALFAEAAVRAWLKSREQAKAGTASGYLAARTRQAHAAALEAEQRIRIKARTLIHVDEVERVWSGQIAAVRSYLLSIPQALADKLHRVAVVDGAAGIERELQRAIYQALTELASGKVPSKPAKARTARKSTRKGKRSTTGTRARH